MAIFTPSHLIGAISGSIGSVTFKLTRNGPLLTKRPRKTRKHSQALHRSQSRWSTLLAHWQSLDYNERRTWLSLARVLSTTNRLGISRPRHAFRLFIQHATPAFYIPTSLPRTAPKHPPLPQLSACSLSFVLPTGGVFTSTISGTISPVYLIIEGSRAIRVPYLDPSQDSKYPPRWYFNSWRLLEIESRATGINAEDIDQPWFSILGYPLHDEPIAVRARIWHPYALESPRTLTSTFSQLPDPP